MGELLDRTVATLLEHAVNEAAIAAEYLGKALQGARDYDDEFGLGKPDEELIQEVLTDFETYAWTARETSGVKPRTVQDIMASINRIDAVLQERRPRA